MTILQGELQRMESQYVRIFRPTGTQQLAMARLLVDPNEPMAGVILYPNRHLAEGEYLLASMSGAREWVVVLRRSDDDSTAMDVHRVPQTRPGVH